MNALFPVFLLIALLAGANAQAAGKKTPPPAQTFDISQTVVKMPLVEGVTPNDAIDALQSKAVELNMKFVAHQPLSKELQARGIDSGRLEIFQFCNPEDAHKMVLHDPIFAAYMPCRIAMVEDGQGRIWLMMINLDMLIDNTELPQELHDIAVRISETLMQIMTAGATGEF